MKSTTPLLVLVLTGCSIAYDPFRERVIGAFQDGERLAWEPQWSEDGSQVVHVVRHRGTERLYIDGRPAWPPAACY